MRESAWPVRCAVQAEPGGLSVCHPIQQLTTYGVPHYATPYTLHSIGIQTRSKHRNDMTTTYSVDDVAKRLDRHPESIRRNLRKGQLEGQKWQGEWVIPDESLRDWLPPAKYNEAFPANNDDEA